MDSNPLNKIIKGVNDLVKQVETGDMSAINPDFKKAFDMMTPEQKADYVTKFKEKAQSNPDYAAGMAAISEKMNEFKNIVSKANGTGNKTN